jgi:hypothetical protein
MPTPNGSPSVQGMVRADLETREQIGVERYGTALQPNNGRDALRDLYEELLDAACYARQAIEERPREDVDAAVAEVRAELEPQLHRQADLIAEMRRQLDASIAMRDKHFGEVKQLRERVGELSETLGEVLSHFVHKGHPGTPCLQTGWVRESAVQRWREVARGAQVWPQDHATDVTWHSSPEVPGV